VTVGHLASLAQIACRVDRFTGHRRFDHVT
jgi:hypothetical protein